MNIEDNDTCRAGCACCLLVAQAIARLKYRNLFSKTILNPAREGVSRNDATYKRYAVTVNIQPTKMMNKRQWRKYDSVQQTGILQRLEAALRRHNPSIKLIELHYETCPNLKNIHFHALYEMPEEFINEVETYYNKFTSTDENTKTPWRTLDISEVMSEAAWLQYIRKEIK